MDRNIFRLHLLLLGLLMSVAVEASAAEPRSDNSVKIPRYRVACCDWMLLKRQKLGEFQRSREVGADGVELDMGPLGKRVLFDNQLRSERQLDKFREASRSTGIAICTIAMSGFYAQNFITRPNYKALVYDCLNLMGKFPGVSLAYLPLGGCGNHWQQPGADHDTLVARLRWAGDAAALRGMTIGIRTGLSAADDIKLLKEVGSRGIKIYYSVQDAVENHRDIAAELQQLGRKRIAQIHISNTDGVHLRDDKAVDMPAIKAALDKIGWGGWLVVERSRDKNRVRDVVFNYSDNVAYLKQIFQ